MNFVQLLQVIAASCLLTIALMLVLRSTHQRLNRWLQSHLLPRYLKPRGVRRRLPAPPVVSDDHERT
jgi:cellulose biosynthesis operon protein BcsF/YhjT